MIRAFQPDDLQTCIRLFIETYSAEPWNNHWSPEAATRYLEEFMANKRFMGFVICDDASIIGALFAHRKTWWTNDELYVDELYIAPRFQGQGYGERLLGYVEDLARSSGMSGLTLLTHRDFPAKSFYLKHGYKQADHVVFMYKGL
jgi:aminoglycoside 6'-N-acetyltransferase I